MKWHRVYCQCGAVGFYYKFDPEVASREQPKSSDAANHDLTMCEYRQHPKECRDCGRTPWVDYMPSAPVDECTDDELLALGALQIRKIQ